MIYTFKIKNTVMAKAKTTVTKEVKQIVLTQEQFNKLRDIQNTIDSETETLKETVGDTSLEPIEIGFNIGSAHSALFGACNDLEEILDEIDPLEYEISWDDEDEN